MRIARVIFVLLIAVGVCGAVYLALTVGLAAFVRYRAAMDDNGGGEGGAGGPGTRGSPASSASRPADAPSATRPGGEAAAAAASPVAPAEPAPPAGPAVEDAAAVLRRTWTAVRPGRSLPSAYATGPAAGRSATDPTAKVAPWWPLTDEAKAAPRPIRPDAVAARRRPVAPPTASAGPGTVEFAPPAADGSAAALVAPVTVRLPAVPPARIASPDPDRLPLTAVGADRDGDRPAASADPTRPADERLLLRDAAPVRSTVVPPEWLSIPDPEPYSAGAVRTVVPDDDTPPTPPDRPTEVRLPGK